MTPIIFRRIIYNAPLQRSQCMQKKKNFQVINRRKFYSFPNGPQDPDYLMIFLTGLCTYFSISMFYKK